MCFFFCILLYDFFLIWSLYKILNYISIELDYKKIKKKYMDKIKKKQNKKL